MRRPAPVTMTELARDKYGIAHIQAPDYFSAGYAIAVAQVDDFGLDLQMLWALLSPDVETRLTQNAIDSGIPRNGQVPFALQFDSRGFPLPVALREQRPPTLAEIRTSLEYMSFYDTVDEAELRINGTLLQYLQGFVAGANARISGKKAQYLASTDPRIQYMVARGLHERTVTLKDPIRAAAAQGITTSAGLIMTWANFIHSVPATTAQVTLRESRPGKKSEFQSREIRYALQKQKLPIPRYTASNEFGFSGAVTTSGRPILMVDPHLPMYGSWWNMALTAVVKTPDIILDGAIILGNPVPFIGHALHPKTQSGFALTGTANAHTPSNCWFAPVPPTLDSHTTAATGGQPAPLSVRTMRGLTIREGGPYGRLIGQKRVSIGSGPTAIVIEVGFFYRAAKDHKYSFIETLWPAFHSKSVSEFHAALNQHAHPYWNMVVGFSTPEKPSTLLYINNQISPRRNPNPDGNPLTLDDWNVFMDANNAATLWQDGANAYHLAHELPQVVAEDHARPFLHCHNCSPELVTQTPPLAPYMIGGYAGYDNPRHAVGNQVYAEAIGGGQKISLGRAMELANHKRDLQLEETVRKVNATLSGNEPLLDPTELQKAQAEMSRWLEGPVDGSADNPRTARVLLWLEKMRAAPGWTHDDLKRVVNGLIQPAALHVFDPDAPLPEADALLPLQKLLETATEFSSIYGVMPRNWSQIQRFRPDIFGTPIGDWPMAGSPTSLLSVGGAVQAAPGGRVHLATGGQNYVQVIEVGLRSALKKSNPATVDPSSPYAGTLPELFAQEIFTPTGVQPSEIVANRILSRELLKPR